MSGVEQASAQAAARAKAVPRHSTGSAIRHRVWVRKRKSNRRAGVRMVIPNMMRDVTGMTVSVVVLNTANVP